MKGICYIIGAGEFYSGFERKECDLVIAADGGYDTLVSRGIKCDLLIGDMDSISNIPSGIEAVRVPVEKDETDMYLAYLEGVRRGYSDFVIFGGVGGRPDHTFANISLLVRGKHDKNRLTLIADHYEIFAIKEEEITLYGAPMKTFSVFAFEAEANGVSVIGGKYEAKNITLKPDFPIGVSNSFLTDTVEISVERGTLIIMKEI